MGRMRWSWIMVVLLLALAAMGVSALDMAGTWKIIYYVRFGPAMWGGALDGKGLETIGPDDPVAPLLKMVRFGPDGMGEVILDSGKTHRFFYEIMEDDRLAVQMQGFGAYWWYTTVLPDERLFVAFQWPAEDGTAVSVMAVMERVPPT